MIKVLETLIRSRMVRYSDENEIVTNCQHGFIKKISCFTYLLSALEDWTLAVTRVMELMLPTLTLVRRSIQCPIKDLFKSWLVMVLVVSCCYGLGVFSPIITKELF